VRVVGVLDGASKVEVTEAAAVVGAGADGAAEDGAAEDSVVGAGEDGASEYSEVEEAGGVLEEMTMVGVKLSDSLVVAPELLVAAEGELGATDEVGANGTEVVVVVHSDVVAVASTVVVV